jgi:hypothetical protein
MAGRVALVRAASSTCLCAGSTSSHFEHMYTPQTKHTQSIACHEDICILAEGNRCNSGRGA